MSFPNNCFHWNKKLTTNVEQCNRQTTPSLGALAKLVQRHCNKSPKMCIGEGLHLQHQDP